MSVALDRIVDALDTRGLLGRESGGQHEAKCPAHDDRKASLRVKDGGDRALVKCHAGCSAEDVMGKLDLPLAALFDSYWSRNGNSRAPLDVYSYTDEDGRPLFEVVRLDGKQFPVRLPGAKEWGIGKTRRVLYRLPRVIDAAKRGQLVFIAEGEKDVHAIERWNVVATCNPFGAGAWRDEYAESLRGAHVVVIPDRDEKGYAHARDVVKSVSSVAKSVEVWEPKAGKDASDHFAAGHSLDFVEVNLSAEPEPATEAPTSGMLEVIEAAGRTPLPVDWVWAEPGHDGRIPAGAMTMLGGLPDAGKSTLSCWIASELTKGALPGVYYGKPRNVLIVSLEDTIDRVMLPRLIAVGADLSHVAFIRAKGTSGIVDLTKHLGEIEAKAKAKNAALVVVDPIIAALGNGKLDSHKDRDVRTVLAPAGMMAERLNLSLVGIGHFSKGAINALMALGGSIGFVGAPRSVLVLISDPNDEDGHLSPRRILGHVKSNWGAKQKSLRATITPHVVEGYGERPISTSYLDVGEEMDADLDELIAQASSPGRPRDLRDEYKSAIPALLELAGPQMRPNICRALGRDPKDRTVRRAVDELVEEGKVGAAGEPAIYSLPQGGGKTRGSSFATRHPEDENPAVEPNQGGGTKGGGRSPDEGRESGLFTPEAPPPEPPRSAITGDVNEDDGRDEP